ncbi:MAG TPA: dihydrofolate reductase [Clostridia bacterium]|nr:dihydrofolate reductase [Clostridia bacterium]
MKAIVAVDLNWGIGYKGDLLQRIPGDMKFFREMTKDKIVVMGRQTFESLPGKAPLKDRVNIVLSRDQSFKDDRLIICPSFEELFSRIKEYDIEDVFVIGGESIYAQLLPYCSEAYVTRFENTYLSDKHFVNIDEKRTWKLISQSNKKKYDDIEYIRLKYINTETESVPCS